MLSRQKVLINIGWNWKKKNKKVYLVGGSDKKKIESQLPSSVIKRCAGMFCCMGNEFWQGEELIYKNKFESFGAGIAGFFATISWFYAFTLIQSSFVRALGQIEIIFSYVSSRFYFKEKIKINEIVGVLIFIIGILILLLFK